MTKIEWVVKVADAIGGKAESWNPIRAKHKKTGKVGWFCIHASEGCRNCYAERWNGWRGNGVKFRAQDIDKVDIYLDEDVLLRPLTWRKRRAVFACDMTDMFGWWVTDEMLDKIFAVIALTPHCIWMVLTKQSERMREYFTGDVERRSAKASIEFIDLSSGAGRWEKHIQAMAIEGWSTWPRPNVWLGVSAENQEQAEARIPALLQTPAAVRFVSAEPLVGAVDLLKWMRPYVSDAIGLLQPVPRLDWVIAGGESGSTARAMHPDWPRGLRDDCGRAGVAFFFKQWGDTRRGRCRRTVKSSVLHLMKTGTKVCFRAGNSRKKTATRKTKNFLAAWKTLSPTPPWIALPSPPPTASGARPPGGCWTGGGTNRFPPALKLRRAGPLYPMPTMRAGFRDGE